MVEFLDVQGRQLGVADLVSRRMEDGEEAITDVTEGSLGVITLPAPIANLDAKDNFSIRIYCLAIAIADCKDSKNQFHSVKTTAVRLLKLFLFSSNLSEFIYLLRKREAKVQSKNRRSRIEKKVFYDSTSRHKVFTRFYGRASFDILTKSGCSA